jgi:nucleoside-diphosphate-sugar epimerase
MNTLKNAQVLVTGGTGFLGSALIRQLVNEGAHVRTVVRHPERNRLLADLPNVEIIAGDLAQPLSLVNALAGCRFVFHVAVSYGDLDEQRRVNVDGTRHLVQMSSQVGVQRLIHISSLAVYGYQVRGLVTEDTPLKPSIEPYSTTKAQAESMVRQYAGDMSYSIVRPGAIYGVNSDMWTHTMFAIARRVPLLFIGDGNGHVPLVYVDDLVDLITLCATHPNAHKQVFNAVYAQPHTWREFLGEYAKLVNNHGWWGIPVSWVRWALGLFASFSNDKSKPVYIRELFEYALSQVVYDTQKARDLLAWQPKTPLSVGIKNCEPYLREQGLL